MPPSHGQVIHRRGAPTAFVEYRGPLGGVRRLDVWNQEARRWEPRRVLPHCAYMPLADRRVMALCDWDGRLRAQEIGAAGVTASPGNAATAEMTPPVEAILLAREGRFLWALAWVPRRPGHVLLLQVAAHAVLVAASYKVLRNRLGRLRFEVLQQAVGDRSLLVRVHGARRQHWLDQDIVIELGDGVGMIRSVQSTDRWLPEYRNREDVIGRVPRLPAGEDECLAALRYRSWQDNGGVRVMCIAHYRVWWLDSARRPRSASPILSVVDGVGACELAKGEVTTFYWNNMYQHHIEVGVFHEAGEEPATTVRRSIDLEPTFRCGIPPQ